jgi:metallo-beta-lactamase family protein
MKITLIGAAGGEVTGSGYIVQTKQARILVDCGLFQGGKKSEALNRQPCSLEHSRIRRHGDFKRWR